MNDPQSPQSQPKKKPNSPFQPKPLSLDERIEKLEESSKGLGEVVDKNAEVMGDLFQVTEARQWMIMRAMDDAGSPNGTKRTEAGNSGPVDWEYYKTEYFKFQEQLQAEAAEAPPPPDETGIPTDAVVFGGEGG